MTSKCKLVKKRKVGEQSEYMVFDCWRMFNIYCALKERDELQQEEITNLRKKIGGTHADRHTKIWAFVGICHFFVFASLLTSLIMTGALFTD